AGEADLASLRINLPVAPERLGEIDGQPRGELRVQGEELVLARAAALIEVEGDVAALPRQALGEHRRAGERGRSQAPVLAPGQDGSHRQRLPLVEQAAGERRVVSA